MIRSGRAQWNDRENLPKIFATLAISAGPPEGADYAQGGVEKYHVQCMSMTDCVWVHHITGASLFLFLFNFQKSFLRWKLHVFGFRCQVEIRSKIQDIEMAFAVSGRLVRSTKWTHGPENLERGTGHSLLLAHYQ